MSANIPDLPRVKPGEVITAEKWNILCDAIEALRVWTVGKDEPIPVPPAEEWRGQKPLI